MVATTRRGFAALNRLRCKHRCAIGVEPFADGVVCADGALEAEHGVQRD